MVFKELKKGLSLGFKAAKLTKAEVHKSLGHFVKAGKMTKKEVDGIAKILRETSKKEHTRVKKLVDSAVKKELKKRGFVKTKAKNKVVSKKKKAARRKAPARPKAAKKKSARKKK